MAHAENDPAIDYPQLIWREESSDEARASNAATVAAIDQMIKLGHRGAVTDAMESWAPGDVLSCFVRLRTKRAQKLLGWMSDEFALGVLNEVDPHFYRVLAEDTTKTKFRKLMDRLPRHKVMDMLTELPSAYVDELLTDHPQESILRSALAEVDSAEAAMRQGAVVIPLSWTIRDVVHDIRRRNHVITKIDALHVVDEAGRLRGYLKLRDLILQKGDQRVGDVARPNPLSVTRDTDQEHVLALAKERGESVIAVVDHENKLLGAITAEELVEIAQEEAHEDMLLMASVSPDSTSFDSPLEIVKRRLPWLLVGLVGALMTAIVVGSYEDTLTQAAILASFIPVVSATAGNASMQASTISIQALTSGATWHGDFLPRLGREVIGAAINGAVMGVGIGLLVFAASFMIEIDRPLALVATVAISQILVILMAGTVGTLVPFVLKALKFDPAVATGIFILTVNDVAGVLILFAVAISLYL
ncbi:MAG: magnesium transporter [Mangrovicoccus sp.]